MYPEAPRTATRAGVIWEAEEEALAAATEEACEKVFFFFHSEFCKCVFSAFFPFASFSKQRRKEHAAAAAAADGSLSLSLPLPLSRKRRQKNSGGETEEGTKEQEVEVEVELRPKSSSSSPVRCRLSLFTRSFSRKSSLMDRESLISSLQLFTCIVDRKRGRQDSSCVLIS